MSDSEKEQEFFDANEDTIDVSSQYSDPVISSRFVSKARRSLEVKNSFDSEDPSTEGNGSAISDLSADGSSDEGHEINGIMVEIDNSASDSLDGDLISPAISIQSSINSTKEEFDDGSNDYDSEYPSKACNSYNDNLEDPQKPSQNQQKTQNKHSISYMIKRFLGISPEQTGLEPESEHVRVWSKYKEHLDFTGLTRTQTLNSNSDPKGPTGPIWTMKFSLDGAFLASGGFDGKVVIWSVGLKPGASREVKTEKRKGRHGTANTEEKFQLLSTTPYKKFKGHGADVVDLSWSKANTQFGKFLVSASVDKTVRLWLVCDDEDRKFPELVFQHPDLVTSVDFHPTHTQDVLFVSGCMDKKIRVWTVLQGSSGVSSTVRNPAGHTQRSATPRPFEGHIKEWANAPEMITSACFSPDGKMVVAGLCRGQVMFYSYINDDLKFFTQMVCRNRVGEFSDGRNVTGICFFKKRETKMESNNSRAATRTLTTATTAPASTTVMLASGQSMSNPACNDGDIGTMNSRIPSSTKATATQVKPIPGTGAGLTSLSKSTNAGSHSASSLFSSPVVGVGVSNGAQRASTVPVLSSTATSSSVSANPSVVASKGLAPTLNEAEVCGTSATSAGAASSVAQVKTEMLVSINDSRIRLCDLDDFSVLCKVKGATNTSMQIKARFFIHFNTISFI